MPKAIVPSVDVKNLTADEGVTEVYTSFVGKATFDGKGNLIAMDFGGRGTKYHVSKDGDNYHVETRRIVE